MNRLRLHIGLGLLVAVMSSAALPPVYAQEGVDWTGETSTDWFTGSNWSGGVVPTENNFVIVDTVTPHLTVIDTGAAAGYSISVGTLDTGSVTVEGGATLTTGEEDSGADIGFADSASGSVTVTGIGSSWTHGGQLFVGHFGAGTLRVESGGAVVNSDSEIRFGNNLGGHGTAIVTGAGSTLTATGAFAFVIGVAGTGSLTISDGGTVSGTQLLIAQQSGSVGTLNIGAAAAEPAAPPGTLDVAGLGFGAGSGTISFNHTAEDYEFSPTLFGTDVVNVLAGTTRLTANSAFFAGTTHISGGTLRVEAALGGTMDVQPGGRLEGDGSVGETTNDGVIAPGESIATLSVSGSFTQSAVGTLEVEIEPGGDADRVSASGPGSIFGTISVLVAPGNYTPGMQFPILSASSLANGPLTVVQDDPSVTFQLVNEGGTLSLMVLDQKTGDASPVALVVDPEPLISDGNEVFDPGERVEVAPAWRNESEFPQVLTGSAAAFTGPAGPDYTLVVDQADYGVVEPGEVASCQVAELCYEMEIDPEGVPRPVLHWDATFDETLSNEAIKTWTLHVGGSFADVPRAHPLYRFIETLLHGRATSGCGGGSFCPADPTARAHVAVFLLRALEGDAYLPPPCVPGEPRFLDVPADHQFCPWIEELARREITAGCGGDNYCPDAAVSRAAAAPLLLRTLEGADYTPPPCVGLFADVPCPSPFAAWIEDLAIRGIATGCDGDNYCPNAASSRAQIAVFVTRAFNLLLYGP